MDILVRYGTHYEAIKKIGSCPLNKTLHLSDLGEPKEMKAISQKCYKGMKDWKLYEGKGIYTITVIDYLCMVSTNYLLYLIESNSKIPREKMSPDDYASSIVKCVLTHREETKNLLRLFFKDPAFLLHYIIQNELLGNNPETYIGITYDFDIKCFDILGALWFTIVRTELLSEQFKDDGGDWLYSETFIIRKFSEQYWEYAINNGLLSKYIKNNE